MASSMGRARGMGRRSGMGRGMSAALYDDIAKARKSECPPMSSSGVGHDITWWFMPVVGKVFAFEHA